MIVSISGTVAAKSDRFLVVETGGLGYRVYATATTLADSAVGSTVKLYTYHHVSETAQDLYGFPTLDGVEFYETLLGISGIGPKTALSVMSVARMDELKMAIQNNDATILTKVSGIGKKTAERIVLELQGKVDMLDTSSTGTEDATVVDALISLGYTRQQARDVVRELSPTIVGVSERVTAALKMMGNHA